MAPVDVRAFNPDEAAELELGHFLSDLAAALVDKSNPDAAAAVANAVCEMGRAGVKGAYYGRGGRRGFNAESMLSILNMHREALAYEASAQVAPAGVNSPDEGMDTSPDDETAGNSLVVWFKSASELPPGLGGANAVESEHGR